MRRIWIVFLSLISFMMLTLNVNAKEIAFNVEVVKHANQISEVGYFDLLVEPNSSHSLLVKISNGEKYAISVNGDVVNASTAVNGTSSLYEIDSIVDKSMIQPLTSIMESKKDIIIEANSEMVVSFDLSVPKEKFEGKIIGGIRFSAKSTETDTQENNNSFVFDNQINYVIGVQIQNDIKIPDINLNLLNNGISSLNYLPTFTSTIQNDKPVLMSNVEIFGEVRNDKNELVGEVKKAQSVIMPNTSFDVAYTALNNKIEAGTYSMYLKIRESDNIWEWRETFKISFDDVNQVNEEVQQVYPDTSTNYMPYIIGIITLLLFLIVLLLLLLFKRRKEDEEEARL